MRRVTLLVVVWIIATCAQAQLSHEMLTRMSASVVQIIPFDNDLGIFGVRTGSGTLISPDGYILTNYHVIADETGHTVHHHHAIYTVPLDPEAAQVPSERLAPPKHTHWAHVIAEMPQYDLALLKIYSTADGSVLEPNLPAAPIGNSDQMQKGDAIFIVGFGGTQYPSPALHAGELIAWLAEDTFTEGRVWMQTNALITKGNSGGAAFNIRGELIGIPTAFRVLAETHRVQSFVRPITLAWGLVGANVSRAWLADPALWPAVQQVMYDQGLTPTPARPPPRRVTAIAEPSGAYGDINAINGYVQRVIAAGEGARSGTYHRYKVTVPAGISSLKVMLDGFGRDVDLAISSEHPLSTTKQVDFIDNTPLTQTHIVYVDPPSEVFYIDVINLLTVPIAYELRVISQLLAGGAVPEAPNLPPAPIGASLDNSIKEQERKLYPQVMVGTVLQNTLTGKSGGVSFQTFVLESATPLPPFEVLVSAQENFNLALKRDSEIKSYLNPSQGGDWHYRDDAPEAQARVHVPEGTFGRWFIDVINASGKPELSVYVLSIQPREGP